MKFRAGFVSNSSSSSFVAVGISRGGYSGTSDKDKQLFIDLMNAMNAPIGSYDYDDLCESDKSGSAKLQYHDHGTMRTLDGSDICFYGGEEFWFVGIDAIPLLKEDMKLSEIREQFKRTVKEYYNIKINLSQIQLKNDEVSSE